MGLNSFISQNVLDEINNSKNLSFDKKEIHLSAPSNIAIVKYWGKKEEQIPRNASLSMTLSKCRSHCFAKVKLEKDNLGRTEYRFEGNLVESFSAKVLKLRKRIEEDFPVLKHISLEIESRNTFPHSAGIASSASSMAAIAGLFINSILSVTNYQTLSEKDRHRLISFYARLGSGSAARSIFGEINTWGTLEGEGTSDLYSEPVEIFSNKFFGMKDYVFIVSDDEKEVSSTAGHNLMNNHPAASVRYQNANENVRYAIKALKEGDVAKLGEIIETEAMQLHGLMMTSNPPYILLRPMSLTIIEKLKEFRRKNNCHLYFTLDAGPNVHVLAPSDQVEKLDSFANQIVEQYPEISIIKDEMGNGIREE